jgi:toxin ParE1/3/4
MKLVWSPIARRDLQEVLRYIAQDNPAAADRTVRRILRAADRLRRFPWLGRAGRLPDTRELVIPRTLFIVTYAVAQRELQIMAVIHGARRWPRS